MSENSLKKILILAANPKNSTPLRLDQEVREIDEGSTRAKQRDRFELEQKWAVRPRDGQRAILDLAPQIVHFSGHGVGEDGLALENENGQAKLVSTQAIAGLFELFADQIECVLLNACYSEIQAKAIAQHIPYVIGMNQAVGDAAAREFAVGFYDALGAGRDIEFAYKLACNSIRMAGIPEDLTPVLLKKETLDLKNPPVPTDPASTPPVDRQSMPELDAIALPENCACRTGWKTIGRAWRGVLTNVPIILSYTCSKNSTPPSLSVSEQPVIPYAYQNEGGALRLDAPTYVKRKADDELFR